MNTAREDQNLVASLRRGWWMYLLKFTTTGLIVGTALIAGLLASEGRYDVLWSHVSVLMIVGVTLLVVAISQLTGAIPPWPKNIGRSGSRRKTSG
jgi:flagellar motor component MotA